MSNYYVNKDNKSGEVVYIEYDSKGYSVKPKIKEDGAIKVDKIVFVSQDFTTKLLKKKIELKLSKLIEELNSSDEDSSGSLKQSIMETEKLKNLILKKYAKYLGESYTSLTLEKIEIILNGFKSKLFNLKTKKDMELLNNYFSFNEENTKKGKGR